MQDTNFPCDLGEYPPQADLRADIYKPLPVISPDAIGAEGIDALKAAEHAKQSMLRLDEALARMTLFAYNLFFQRQAYWRDIVALTITLRTFNGP